MTREMQPLPGELPTSAREFFPLRQVGRAGLVPLLAPPRTHFSGWAQPSPSGFTDLEAMADRGRGTAWTPFL